jgi:hypothetical protein
MSKHETSKGGKRKLYCLFAFAMICMLMINNRMDVKEGLS